MTESQVPLLVTRDQVSSGKENARCVGSIQRDTAGLNRAGERVAERQRVGALPMFSSFAAALRQTLTVTVAPVASTPDDGVTSNHGCR